MISALGDLRDPTTRSSWAATRRLLLSCLKANDNMSNAYSDSNYIACVVTAIGNAFSTTEREERDMSMFKEAAEAVDRAVTMDRLVPSFGNIVTQAGLKVGLSL